MIIYSTGPNSIAWDGANGKADSPFASAFAAAISAGGLEIRDVFDRVEASVDQVTHHEQQPWISYSTGGKLYFKPTHPADVLSESMLDTDGSLCPKPGTVVAFTDAGQTMTGTYQPTDPSRPALCRLSLSNGGTRTLLYNLYDPKTLVDQASASGALWDLLSGRRNHVEFETQQMTSYPFPKFLESWTRMGQEAVEIDNHHVEAIVFEHDSDGFLGNGWNYQTHKRWKVWYDLSVGVVRQTAMPLNESRNDAGPGGPQVVFVSPF